MKLKALTAAVLATALLSACGSSAASSAAPAADTSSETAASADNSGDLLAQIQQRGEIVFGTEGTWSPWTYHDENDQLVGFDIEVAQKVAEKLGVKATFVEGEWDGLLAGVDGGRYDSMANGVEITEECNLVRRTEKGRLRRRGWGLRWEKAQKGGKGTNLRGFFED